MFRDVSQELGAARNQRNSAVQFRQIRENGENEVPAHQCAAPTSQFVYPRIARPTLFKYIKYIILKRFWPKRVRTKM